MSKYLLIASEDPFEGGEGRSVFALAESLARAQNQVTLFLVQNGVLAARDGEPGRRLAPLAAAGIEVLADDFSLRERGIGEARLASAVKSVSLDVVVDGLADGVTALWH